MLYFRLEKILAFKFQIYGILAEEQPKPWERHYRIKKLMLNFNKKSKIKALCLSSGPCSIERITVLSRILQKINLTRWKEKRKLCLMQELKKN